MPESPQHINLFFRLVVVAGAVFVVTIFALVATIFGDPEAPVTRFLNEHGGTILVVEVVAILLIGLLAMAVDRRQTLRKMRTDQEEARRSPRAKRL